LHGGFQVNAKSFLDRVRQRKRRIRKRLDRDNFPEGDGPVMRASNIHFELGERTLATNYGGIGLMYQLARESELIEAIDQNLSLFRVHLPYHESDHVLNIAFNAFCDGTCLEDIEHRRQDAPSGSLTRPPRAIFAGALTCRTSTDFTEPTTRHG
jgi:hypothetical protein